MFFVTVPFYFLLFVVISSEELRWTGKYSDAFLSSRFQVKRNTFLSTTVMDNMAQVTSSSRLACGRMCALTTYCVAANFDSLSKKCYLIDNWESSDLQVQENWHFLHTKKVTFKKGR